MLAAGYVTEIHATISGHRWRLEFRTGGPAVPQAGPTQQELLYLAWSETAANDSAQDGRLG